MKNRQNFFAANLTLIGSLTATSKKTNFFKKKELLKQKSIFLLGKAAQTVKYFFQGSFMAHFNYNLF